MERKTDIALNKYCQQSSQIFLPIYTALMQLCKYSVRIINILRLTVYCNLFLKNPYSRRQQAVFRAAQL